MYVCMYIEDSDGRKVCENIYGNYDEKRKKNINVDRAAHLNEAKEINTQGTT